jgi:hypothetical protein
MAHVPPADQAHLPHVRDDSAPPDCVLKRRIYEAQHVAIQALRAFDYTQAKLSAGAARRDSKIMCSRFEEFHGTVGHAAADWFQHETRLRFRHRTNVEYRQLVHVHGQLQSYVECTDALCNAIEAHKLAHVAELGARSVGNTTNVEARTGIFRDVVSSPHASCVWGQLVDPDVLLMISDLAVVNPDDLMWESITQYERYHLHAIQYNSAVDAMTRLQIVYTPGMDIAEYSRMHADNLASQMLNVHHALRLHNSRHDANQAHLLRMSLFSPAQHHAYNLAVRGWLAAVTQNFTPQENAAFALTQTLHDAYDDARTNGIMTSLQTFLVNRANTHHVAAKRDLTLRNFADCSRNAQVAIDAYDLSVHCVHAQWSPYVFLMLARRMHMSRMFLAANEELRLAYVQQEMAQCHAVSSNLERTTFYTDKATKHLNRHDDIVRVVNHMLLENYNEDIDNVNPNDANGLLNFENTNGPVPTTAMERVRNSNTVQEARRGER